MNTTGFSFRFPMDRLREKAPPVVVVEYDCRGCRVGKEFSDPYRARSFYGQKLRAGKRPKVTKP